MRRSGVRPPSAPPAQNADRMGLFCGSGVALPDEFWGNSSSNSSPSALFSQPFRIHAASGLVCYVRFWSACARLASTASRLRRKCPTTDSSPEFGALRTDSAWSKRTYWSKKSSLDWSRCPSVFFVWLTCWLRLIMMKSKLSVALAAAGCARRNLDRVPLIATSKSSRLSPCLLPRQSSGRFGRWAGGLAD
jgi:hypothetical protein